MAGVGIVLHVTLFQVGESYSEIAGVVPPSSLLRFLVAQVRFVGKPKQEKKNSL